MTERPTAHTRSGSKDIRGGAPEAIRIKLLGEFSVSVGSRVIQHNEWRLKKASALVKLLAFAPGHRLHREQLMDLLWPDSGRKAASNSLRRTLHAARRTLDPAEGSGYLASEGESLVLCPGGNLWVDVEAFEEAATTARHSREPAAYRAALELYAGELLPEDRYEAWAEEKHEELRRLYLDLIIGLARAYEERGDLRRGLEALQEAVTVEPTLEEAHAGVMRLYALLGQEGQALSQYQRLREILSRQLATEPGSATRTLYEDLVSGRFSPAPSQHAVPLDEYTPDGRHNLPASRSSFVGREHELTEIQRALAMTRMLTLTGPGGSGKTRLALEVARDLLGTYPDGVWLVELAPLSEGELVAKTVAEALGVPERPQELLSDTLADVLRNRETLLLMDNCEHLVEAAARLVDALLDSCARLRVLATSREALGLEGEIRWPVPTLSVPERGRDPSPEELEGYESIRLFVERARRHDPSFSLNLHNRRAVADICVTLEGMPLAVELAAARVGSLPLNRISERLEGSIELLTRGGRTAPARQRTLRGTLDWSYDLLSEPVKVLFRRLSVFVGGWTLEAPGAVASGEGIEESEVLDLLSELVEKSLVVVDQSSDGGMRYRLLEPVRQYASDKLEERGETEATKGAHGQYYLALAEEAEPELLGPQEARWYERLEEEHDNLRAALSWSLEGAHPEVGLRIAGAIWWFWHRHGHLREGQRWLEVGLDRGRGAPATARAKALGGIGWLAFGQADLDLMRQSAIVGLNLSAEAGLGDNHRALFLNLLAHASSHMDDYEQARKLAEESLALSREVNDVHGMAESLHIMGLASVWQPGGQEQARTYFEEGLDITRGELGSPSVGRALLNSLGLAFLLQGDLQRAKALAEETAALSREAGDKTLLPLPLNNLGWAALLEGDLERAKALHKESLALSKELGGSLHTIMFLEGIACDAGAEGSTLRAARLFGAAQTLRDVMSLPLEPALRPLEDPYVAGARSQVDEGAWRRAWEEGRTLSMEAAIEYAFSEGGDTEPAPQTLHRKPAGTHQRYLTHREEEVAALAAQGLTNRQIAARLVISESTTETHLSRIFKKLGLRSRTQLTAWMNDQERFRSNSR